MGKRGPAPKPSQAKVLQGTFRKDRAAPNEWKPEPGAPPCPSWLSTSAKKEWRRMAGKLEKAKLISPVDLMAFASYCSAAGMLADMDAKLGALGGEVTFKTPNGYIQQHPLVGIVHQLRKQVAELAREFGLSPSSRTKVSAGADEDKKGDPWDEL